MGEGLGCELVRTVWVGVITLPLIPSHRGRGNELLNREGGELLNREGRGVFGQGGRGVFEQGGERSC